MENKTQAQRRIAERFRALRKQGRTIRDHVPILAAVAKSLYRQHHAKHHGWLCDPVQDRLRWRLLSRYRAEIRHRGGSTIITHLHGCEVLSITDRQPKERLALLHVEGWKYYSRKEGSHHAHLSYLCGMDESGPWAVRVPGTLTMVSEAVLWITPAAVRRAQANGKRVLRQGDVYVVETIRDQSWNLEALPFSHRWNPETRILSHEGHGDLHVPFPCHFYRQIVLEMEMGHAGRGGD
jgi:hypothetical protein